MKQVTFAVSNYYVEKRFWNTVDCVQAVVEGVELGSYHYQGYKKDKNVESIEDFILVVDPELEEGAIFAGMERAEVAASATKLARDLVNEPSNLMTPAILGREG